MIADRRATFQIALFTAMLVFAVMLGSDILLERTQPTSFWPYLIDDLVMSTACGGLVWFYERRRRRELAAKLHVISEMNHRVRNELQVIQYSSYTATEKERMAIVTECVMNIEAALREILEGRKGARRTRVQARSASPDQ